MVRQASFFYRYRAFFSHLIIFGFLLGACSPEMLPTPASRSPIPLVTQSAPVSSPTPLVSSSTFPATAAATSGAQAVPTTQPAGPEWVQVVGGLERPVGLADPGDGSGRLLVLEQ